MVAGCASKQQAQSKPAAFWPPYPDEPRIQYLTSFKSSTDVEPPKSGLDQLIYGKEQQQSLSLNKPYGIRMWSGKIYVCDLRSQAVTVMDVRNKKTLVMGRGGTDNLQWPCDIDITPDGTKYVADNKRGQIAVFDAQDRHVGNLGVAGMVPVGIAVYQNELYVADFAKQQILVLDRISGKQLRTVGSPGQGPGQFIKPLGVAVDKDGNLYVTDVLKCQVQKFNHQGKLLTSFGIISANAGGFVRPKMMAVDKDGIIYVVDAAFQNVQLFDQNGHPLTFFGAAGTHPGAMYLPAGVCVHEGDLELFAKYVHPAFEAQRLILVTNQFGDDKVAVYALGHLKAGKTVADISNTRGLVPAGTGEQKLTGIGAPLPPNIDANTQPPGGTTTQPAGGAVTASENSNK
jgi:hypothetical protein